MSKKEVIGKIVKVVLRSLANSYAFVNANGGAYYFSIPDINEAKSSTSEPRSCSRLW